MDIFNFFRNFWVKNKRNEARRLRDGTRHANAQARREPIPFSKKALSPMPFLTDTDKHPHKQDVIYDVLGTESGVASLVPPPSLGRQADTNADQLLDRLYAQYRLALILPDVMQQETQWIPGNLYDERMEISPEYPRYQVGTAGTVTDFFHEKQSLEQAFELLQDSELSEALLPEKIPEVLRLFAPPEFQLADKRIPAFPAALARREHHSLSIDSPVVSLDTFKPTNE